jgi:hypothetical protein
MSEKPNVQCPLQTLLHFQPENPIRRVASTPRRAMLETKRNILKKLTRRMRCEQSAASSNSIEPFSPGLQSSRKK